MSAVNENPAQQVLLGSGLRFRTDLHAFGGSGLNQVSEVLHSRLSRADAGTSFAEVGLGFLAYAWQPPAAAQPKKAPPPAGSVTCRWCSTVRSDGKHFNKMGFDYCTTT